MNKKDLRIVFLGTPEFAVATLKALVENEFHVVAVVTAPDKAAGRGMQVQQSAVKKFAVEHHIDVLQPTSLKNPEFLAQLSSYNSQLQVVVAFRMLPEAVWNMPPLGTFNVHASLLPQYRGAAPINRAIMNGETLTGVSTFKLVHEIDKGNILLQDQVAIQENDNAGYIHDLLMHKGAELMVKTIEQLLNGSLSEQAQDNYATQELKHAPKIFTDDCRIDWQNRAQQIHNQIRGLSPYPAAFTTLNHKILKIYKAHYQIAAHEFEPGTFLPQDKQTLRIACTDGFVIVEELQLEGKRKMQVSEFLNGYKF